MKILQLNKPLIIILSVLILVGCDNYELVNTDEYHVVKKHEIREFESKIQWDGLNISTYLEVKHLDGKLYYKILVEDLEGESIHEKDYYEVLINKNLLLFIYDKDDFELVNYIDLPVSTFDDRIGKDNKRYSLVRQGSLRMEETTYIQIVDIRVGTSGQ
jgi:hypothetical protein|tara:strand:- start:241 stop:717 length:477 start_codon:yes stop_codon:yes gene_type:complete